MKNLQSTEELEWGEEDEPTQESESNEKFKKALQKFADTSTALLDCFYDLDYSDPLSETILDCYPLDGDFQDINSQIVEWANEVTATFNDLKLAKLPESSNSDRKDASFLTDGSINFNWVLLTQSLDVWRNAVSSGCTVEEVDESVSDFLNSYIDELMEEGTSQAEADHIVGYTLEAALRCIDEGLTSEDVEFFGTHNRLPESRRR